jgi:group I intron endonuclease
METYGYIYLTINKINNKKYIGQHKGHWDFKYFGSGKLLHYAITKYGIENFDHYPLCLAFNKEELNQLEIDFIEYYKPEYNIAPGGYGGCCGEWHKRIISEKLKGKPFSEEHKRKLKENHSDYSGENNPKFGRLVLEETRKKISEANKGRIFSKEHKIKLSEAHKGRIISEETRLKLSEAHKGEKNPMFGKIVTDETRLKLSESTKGEKNGMYGKHHTEETKRKIRETKKLYWSNRKIA